MKPATNVEPFFLTTCDQQVKINFNEDLDGLVVSSEDMGDETTIRTLELSKTDVEALCTCIKSRFDSLKANKMWSSVTIYGTYDTIKVQLTDNLKDIQICGEAEKSLSVYLTESEANQFIFDLLFMLNQIS